MHEGRYADVLISLYTARKNKPRLGRLQLQKYIYLCDSISLLWNQAALGSKYITYKHGPYDRQIQNAVDALAFRGLVTIASLDMDNSKKASALYEITHEGCKLVEQIRNTPPFSRRLLLCEQVSDSITERGWKNLLSLVYADPTYVREGGIGWGRQIKMNSLAKNISSRVIAFFSSLTRDGTMSEENITTLYFELLDQILVANEPRNVPL